MDPNQAHEVSEHQRLQQQFLLFQESLPKVDETVYRMLLNEAVPLAISVENELSKGDTDTTDSLDEELKSKLTLRSDQIKPSHKLLLEYLAANEEKQARIKKRLSSMGFQLGQKLSQLLIFSNNPSLS